MTNGVEALPSPAEIHKVEANPRRPRRFIPTSDRVDRTLSVTSARGWIALIVILATAVAVGVWSFLGEVATYVDAHGFLLNRGGKVVDAVATGRGRLDKVLVTVGDGIETNAVVALISNEELAAQHASALALVEERAYALDALKAAVAEEAKIVHANNTRRRKQLDELEATALDMLNVAQTNHGNSRKLYEDRIIQRVDLERSQQELNRARRVLLDLSRDRGLLEANEIKYENDNAVRIREMTGQVEIAKRRLDEIESLLSTGKVLAPVSGQVTEIKATTGSVVHPGVPLVSIRTGTTELEILLYVPPDKGKQVQLGMQALVSPTTVRREEFGAIKGTVASLSPFPVSFEGIVAVLQNENLARSFSSGGPPYAGRVALHSDPATESGFAWTSPKASNLRLTAGTLASVEIKTRAQAPITLAVPLLKELLGMR